MDRRTFVKATLAAGAGLVLTGAMGKMAWGGSSPQDIPAQSSVLQMAHTFEQEATVRKPPVL